MDRFSGANRAQTAETIDRVLAQFEPGDILLIQNEINLIGTLIDKAYARGLVIALNPSPLDSVLDTCDLRKVGFFLLNEVEGEQLTGKHDEADIIKAMGTQFPDARIVLTLGEKGVLYHDPQHDYSQPAFPVEVVDSTAAGDTFTGFFLAAITKGLAIADALRIAAKAASISVCRKGASSSIPAWEEVERA